MTASEARFTINAVATFTTEPLDAALRSWCTAAVGTNVHVTHCGFDTVMKELLSPASTFSSALATASANIVFVRAADVKDELCDALSAYNVAETRATLIVVGCPGSVTTGSSFAMLKSMCNPLPRVFFAEAADFLAPSEIELDRVSEELGAMPYTQRTYDALAAVAARALAYSRRVFKAICVDCDNTLWQGVVGEVGGEGVVGNMVLMRRLSHAKAHGALLITVSKNIEKDVQAAFAAHPDWPLQACDFVAHKVSYDAKSASIIDVAAQLQLSRLCDFCFLDDNPAEIGEVQANARGVTCMHVPTDRPDDYARACWPLDALKATREDTERTTRMHHEAARQGARPLDFGEWISSLRITIGFEAPTSDDDRARVVQMAARTNQFNFTTERLAAFPPPPVQVAIVRVADRYGDYGVVGTMIYRIDGQTLALENFMMSCRVLGRGVEQAMMAWIGACALKAGCTSVRLTFIATERNVPARHFLSDYGLLPADGGDADGGGAALSTRLYDAQMIAAVTFDPGRAQTSVEQYGQLQRAALKSSAPPSTQACTAADTPMTYHAINPMTYHEIAHMQWESAGRAHERAVSSSAPIEDARVAGPLAAMRALWTHVLAERLDDGTPLDDDVPFGAYGGDSVLAVQLIGLADRHGLSLPHSLANSLEALTIGQLLPLVHAPGSVVGVHGAAGSGGAEAASALECPTGAKQSSAVAAPPHALTSNLSAAPPPAATSVRIIERDGRDPKMPLRPVGGLSACAAGDLESARQLVETIGWDAAHAADKHGNSALMWAAGGGHTPVVQWLLHERRVPVDACNKDGRSAIMWACKNGHYATVRYLIDDANADVTLRMKDDSTTFDWAVLGGDVPTMELLASHPKVDIRALNKFGCAAVQWAAAAGNVSTCRWLLAKGIDFTHINTARHGAIVKAAWKGHRDALEWLLFAADGPQLTEQLDLLDCDGRTVAQLCRTNAQHTTADWLQSLIEARQAATAATPPPPICPHRPPPDETLARDRPLPQLVVREPPPASAAGGGRRKARAAAAATSMGPAVRATESTNVYVLTFDSNVGAPAVQSMRGLVEALRPPSGGAKGELNAKKWRFHAEHPNWKSDIRWVSAADEATFRGLFAPLFAKLAIAEHFRFLGDMTLFSGFLVLRKETKKSYFHKDFGDTGNKAFTLMTPLYDMGDLIDCHLLCRVPPAADVTDGTVGTADVGDDGMPSEPLTKQYRYTLGQAIAFGDGFEHATQTGSSPRPLAFLCFTFGDRRCTTDEWHAAEEYIREQGPIYQRPDGSLAGTGVDATKGS